MAQAAAAPMSKAQRKNENRKKKRAEETSAAVAAPADEAAAAVADLSLADAVTPAAAEAVEAPTETSEHILAKRVKKIVKALKQIDELKNKQAGGVQLDADQQAKVAKEDELRAELAELQG